MKTKPDLVYILGTGSRWEDSEIRYSLRSVEKHLKGYGNVFIVGRCPGFVNKEHVTHIPAEDIHDHKLKNAMHKILIACGDDRISENFILMNDDFLFLQDANVPLENRRMSTLKNMEDAHHTKAGYYFKAINETRQMMAHFGLKDESHEVHYPMHFNKKMFRGMTEKLWSYLHVPYLYRSAYANLYKVKGEYHDDQKLYEIHELEALKKGDFMSTDNRVVLTPEFYGWINGTFPNKSKYEL